MNLEGASQLVAKTTKEPIENSCWTVSATKPIGEKKVKPCPCNYFQLRRSSHYKMDHHPSGPARLPAMEISPVMWTTLYII